MALAHSPRIVTDGLVLCLDAGNTKSYPGSGTTWTDLSGNGNNGSLVNGVGFDGGNGGSLVFDNVNDYIDVTSFSSTTLNNCTITAWVNDTSVDTNYRAIVQNNVAFDDALYINPSGYLMWWPSTSSSLVVPKNKWNFVAASHTYGSGILYQVNNNSQFVSGTFLDPTDWDFIRIGGHSGGDSERWGGNIAQVSIYNKALTASEIQQNFNALRSRFSI